MSDVADMTQTLFQIRSELGFWPNFCKSKFAGEFWGKRMITETRADKPSKCAALSAGKTTNGQTGKIPRRSKGGQSLISAICNV